MQSESNSLRLTPAPFVYLHPPRLHAPNPPFKRAHSGAADEICLYLVSEGPRQPLAAILIMTAVRGRPLPAAGVGVGGEEGRTVGRRVVLAALLAEV